MNEGIKSFIVQYKNGTTRAIDYSDKYTSSSGMFLTQEISCDVKKGDRVKKGDILCYNKQYFRRDPNSKNVSWMHGHHANVLMMESDWTFEDACVITKKLGGELAMNPVYERVIELDKNTLIHKSANVGDKVEYTDYILYFEEGFIDIVTEGKTVKNPEYLSNLLRHLPKAKYTGTIVKIEAYYGCAQDTMHPTLANFVRRIQKDKVALAKMAKGTDNAHLYPEPKPLPKGTKMPGGMLDENTVLIKYYIQADVSAGFGDKLVFDSCLKSVVSKVLEEPIYTESGVEVDAIFSGASVSRRIITSPLSYGITTRVLMALEEEVLDIYFDAK